MNSQIEPIRILHIVSNMQQGGIENFIMNIYRNIDRNKVQFDFLVHYKKKFFFDDEINKLGGKIYRLSFMEDKNIFKYYRDLNMFFKKHKEYKIIHAHMGSLGGIYLNIAKKHGVSIRIAHSHGASHLNTLKGYMKFFMNKSFKYKANIHWACSTEAGVYMYGNKIQFELIPNAINVKKFQYNETSRKKIREELNILDDEFLIGHIGRFNLQKNHRFIIKIFKEIVKIEPKTKLVLVGVGNLQEEIKQEVIKQEIENKVIFLNERSDVADIYSAMDLFILPSLFEGLPVSGIEAQASGLNCIFSENVSRETNITNLVKNISLNNEILWIDTIIECKKKRNDRKLYNKIVSDSKFNIKTLKDELEKKYIELYEQCI